MKENISLGLSILNTLLIVALFMVSGGLGTGATSTTSSTIVAAGFTTTGTLSAEQLTSTDDATITDALTVSGATTLSTLTQGGGITATSTTNAAETLLATDIDTENWVAYTPANGNTALTLVASSTFPGIDTAGQCRTIIFENVSSVTATTTTLVAGTGIDLQETDGGNVVIGGNNYAVVDFCRRADTDIAAFVMETIPAD